MLNINEIVIATNGKLINGENTDYIPKNYILDSREASKGDFFVPIVGNRSNGNDYIVNTVENGVCGFFISKDTQDKDNIIAKSIEINSNIYIIEVNDTIKAMQDAAIYNRNKHIDIPVVAVTGSVGKTSTREMISSVLKQEKIVFTTQRNYNGNIGMPTMILQMDKQDICVFEAGIDTIGEMEILSNMLKPDVAVITMIGTAHIEFFKSRQGIYDEKIQITNHIKGIKKLIVNGNDDYLKNEHSNEKYNVDKFGLNDAYDIQKEEDKITFKTKIYGTQHQVVINQLGEHNIMNALCAIKIGEIFGLSADGIINGIASYKNFVRRLERKVVGDNVTLIDDTYNASIDSMKSGLVTVNSLKAKRRIAVLGNMLELGDYSEELHRDVGKIFKDLDYDLLYTSGDLAKYIAIEAKPYFNEECIKSFNSKEELQEELKLILKSGDLVYLKASNIMKFNEIIKELENM